MADTLQTIETWESVWLRAVALSWEDASFRAALLENPHKALAERFRYTIPNTVEVKIQAPLGKDVGYHPGRSDTGWVLPPAVLTLQLPPPPDTKPQDWAIALANYANDDGYPLTTC